MSGQATIQSLQAQQAQLIAQQAEALRLLTGEVSEMRAAMVDFATGQRMGAFGSNERNRYPTGIEP